MLISVTDDGVGLPAQDRARLTEPYVTHKPKGTGLGLAIVKKIMEDHGGRLLLDDRPTDPARSPLVLPLATPGALPRPVVRACLPPVAGQPGVAEAATAEGCRMAHDILIVDDEPDIWLLIDGVLRDEGYDTRRPAMPTPPWRRFELRRPVAGDPRCLAARLAH